MEQPQSLPDGATLKQKLDRIEQQLDTFGPKSKILEKYQMLHDRDRGGQAIVQYVMRVNRNGAKFYAIKFFASMSHYENEIALYRKFEHFTPVFEGSSDNTRSRHTDKLGNTLPPYIIMERGKSLKLCLESKKLGFWDAMQVVMQISERIAELHKFDYVHRDLKPGNILWQESTRTWVLIDFGHSAKANMYAGVALTPSYAAPEVAKACIHKVNKIPADPAVDTWSLGVIAMELLLQRSPLIPPSTALRVLSNENSVLPWDDPQFTQEHCDKLGQLREPLLRLLHRNPGNRCSPSDLKDEFWRIFQDKPAVSNDQRNKWLTKMMRGARNMFPSIRSNQNGTGLPLVREVSGISGVSSTRSARSTRETVRHSSMEEVSSLQPGVNHISDQECPSMNESDSGRRPSTGPQSSLSEASTSPQKLKHSSEVICVAWSPNGSMLAAASRDFSASLWAMPAGNRKHTLTGHSNRVSSLAWSPDSSIVATGSWDSTAMLWCSKNGACLHVIQKHEDCINCIAWNVRGDILAIGSSDSRCSLHYMPTAEMGLLTKHSEPVTSVAWSHSGGYVVTGAKDGSVFVWLSSGQYQVSLIGHEGSVSSVAWSPDDEIIVTAGGHSVRLWASLNGALKCVLSHHNGAVSSVAWRLDSSVLAIASGDGSASLWKRQCRTVVRLKGHEGEVTSITWSPDGRFVATGSVDGTVKLWDGLSGDRLLTFSRNSSSKRNRVNMIAWEKDGNHLATASCDHSAVVWDIDALVRKHLPL